MIVGVLGGGQLGRMLAMAGHRIGARVRCFDPDPEACAGQVTELVVGGYDDTGALGRLIDGCDVVTYEFENVPVEAAAWCGARVETHPAGAALAAAQDRMKEKSLLRAHGLEPAPHVLVESEEGLHEAIGLIGLPAVLKTCRGGYDGKGQAVLREEGDAGEAWSALGGAGPLVLEGFVPFGREVSLLAVRSRGSEVRYYDPVRNEHSGGILVRSTPAEPVPDAAELERVQRGVASLMEGLGYVGVLALELFETSEGRLIANEMAPRVHNSGHWTIDAAACDQFENHLRAVLGWPLGSTQTICGWEMRNLLGSVPPAEELLGEEGLRLHAYGKSAKAGRKVGHVTVVGARAETAEADVPSMWNSPNGAF